MELAWYALLGLLFGAYLVLGGYDYGVGVLLAGSADPAHRRLLLNAVGPFFLGNEVWLVAAVGVLFGAFPALEGELLSGLYPLVVAALTGVILVTAAVQLRSRSAGPAGRSAWDRLVVIGGALAATGWGAVLAGLMQGIPPHAEGAVIDVTHVLTPFSAAGGLALLALVAVHGAAFLAVRLPPASAAPFLTLGRRLVPVALTAVAAAAVLGVASDRVRDSVQQPAVAVLLPVLMIAALLAARAALARRRPGLALAGTALAVLLPVVGVAASTWPYALVGTPDPTAGLTVAEAAASPPTLRLLSWLTVPLFPALLGFQAMCWWVFRGRVHARSPVYW